MRRTERLQFRHEGRRYPQRDLVGDHANLFLRLYAQANAHRIAGPHRVFRVPDHGILSARAPCRSRLWRLSWTFELAYGKSHYPTFLADAGSVSVKPSSVSSIM